MEKEIHVQKWYKNCCSPVVLMIDDFANCWVDANNNGVIDPGEDWGYNKYNKGSAMDFLENKLLDGYPDIKVTFFVPVGKRAEMIITPVAKQTSKAINEDQESKAFFSTIHKNSRYELAYHGTTHGKPGEDTMDFVDEWLMYDTYQEAIDTIAKGIGIFEDATGVKPLGGKYCAYISKSFSDETIDNSGFLWWCRFWNRGELGEKEEELTGGDKNPITNFDVKFFGNNKVIDIPSTINGEMFQIVGEKKGLIKNLINKCRILKRTKDLDYFLKNRLIISIQEHISPSRADGKIQRPNIYSDYYSLRYMFKYFSKKNVWFCTCSELASYVYCRENSHIEIKDNKTFRLSYKNDSRIANPILSLHFNRYKTGNIKCPDGSIVGIKKNMATIPVQNGIYEIISQA
ncbi:MAG: hypothetical protein GX660_04505 [Clostridiaceae bacterium]|nr:hypothetical protein [Clostridiaceae bacterium]